MYEKAREITFGAVSAKSNLFELCRTDGAASGVSSLLEQSRVATEEDDSQVVTKVMVRSNINFKLPFGLLKLETAQALPLFFFVRFLQFQNKVVPLLIKSNILRFCENNLDSLRRRPSGAARYLLTDTTILIFIP